MVKTKIQQYLATRNDVTLLIIIVFTLFFSSCVQLRYTNYGKPFDFLKSKNQHHSFHKVKQDTASVFETTSQNITDTLMFDEIGLTLSKSDFLASKEAVGLVNSSESSITENIIKFKESEFIDWTENRLIKNKQISLRKFEKTDYLDVKKIHLVDGPGWWEDFWKGIWNFLLKWLLIFLAFFVLIALVIWGIYLLISIIAGPLAAGIFLSIVLILFWILMNS